MQAEYVLNGWLLVLKRKGEYIYYMSSGDGLEWIAGCRFGADITPATDPSCVAICGDAEQIRRRTGTSWQRRATTAADNRH
jgi:hypothetical protein